MKKLFITDYVGLSTRLEALALAFVISDYYGHEVCLDWPELDSFKVVGAKEQGLGIAGRMGALRMRNYSDELFYKIKDHDKVILRTHKGPAHLLERYYIPTAQRVKLRPDYVYQIRETFGRYANRPVVGVHIRRGDFKVANGDVFDANHTEWPGTPTWWYEFVLGKIAAVHKNAAFFISCTGDSDSFQELKKNFDVFELPTSSPYGYKGPDHDSKRHPMADLFALACCNVIVGSTCSTFSHYAANALGAPSTCLVPPPKTRRDDPQCGSLDLYGKGAYTWYKSCREGTNLKLIAKQADLPEAKPVQFKWL
ncbi:MAG: hypothetical protein JWQ71_1348 [Pedosphaera sp.]|nr:hypothetical protein [Pedosphaera sp.]